MQTKFSDVFAYHPMESIFILAGIGLFCCFFPFCIFFWCYYHRTPPIQHNDQAVMTDVINQTEQQTSPNRVLPRANTNSDIMSLGSQESLSSSSRENLQHLIDMKLINKNNFNSLTIETQEVLASPVGAHIALHMNTPSTTYSTIHLETTFSTLETFQFSLRTPAFSSSPIRQRKPKTDAERITQRIIDAYGIIVSQITDKHRAISPRSI